MDLFWSIVDMGVSVGCKANRLYWAYGRPILKDAWEGAPKLLSGTIPSEYEIEEGVKAPAPKEKRS